MSIHAWSTLGCLGVLVLILLTTRIGVDVVMAGGLAFLMIIGAIPVEAAARGFGHRAVILIGALFVIAAGLQHTGAAAALLRPLLGHPKSVRGALARLTAPAALLSGFMNNTTVVALYLPVVQDWGRRLQINSSKLFMPLSFSAILGGKLSYLGSASNVVVMSLYAAQHRIGGTPEISAAEQFWGITWLGVPTTLAGLAFILLAVPRLLTDRAPLASKRLDMRRYQVRMEVTADSPLVGCSIREASLRGLRGLFLSDIERRGTLLPAVASDTRIEAGDRLGFVGILDSVVELRKIRGLVPAPEQTEKVDFKGRDRTLVEVVVCGGSHLVGRTVRETQFRTIYDAAIIAVHRRGSHLRARIGDLRLHPGDVLLLETHDGFVRAYQQSNAFYIVAGEDDAKMPRHDKRWLALTIFGLLILLFTMSDFDVAVSAWCCALLMVAAGCLSGREARRAIDGQVLIAIACSLGLGDAMLRTGAAQAIAHQVGGLVSGSGMFVQLLTCFLMGSLFSVALTNNGAAALMFPITTAMAARLGANPKPFIYTMMVGVGSNFLSPTYQTNLMVFGLGHYRFCDFLRLGVPLTLLVGGLCAYLAPLLYP